MWGNTMQWGGPPGPTSAQWGAAMQWGGQAQAGNGFGGGAGWQGGAAFSQAPGSQPSSWCQPANGGNGNSWSGDGGSWSKKKGGDGGGNWPVKGSCFTCGSTDHQQDECPKYKAFFVKRKEWKPPDTTPDVDVEAVPHMQPFLAAPQFQTPEQRAAVMAHRESVKITVVGESPAVAVSPILTFSELDGVLPPYVTGALAKMGIEAPMPIQQQAMPYLLQGFDLIGIAKTGSGKTMAFLLPAIVHLERCEPMPYGECAPMALVLAPVRELAVQIAEEANKILWHAKSEKYPKGAGCVALYGGGIPIRFRQIDELKKGFCQFVAGTPGRVVDLAISGDLKLERVKYFVLDEADRMLDSGFGEQMDAISDHVSAERQLAFFSATWPLPVRKLAKGMCKAPPIRVNVGQAEEQVSGESGPAARNDIVQEIVVCDSDDWNEVERQKLARLNSHVRELLQDPQHKILVFVSMKQMTWELAEKLKEEGFKADFMYGGRSQDARHEVVRSLKTGEIKLLVSTDVMARGLDIPNISHVVVYDGAGDIEEYVHRIGRTARGPYGKGHALTFYSYDPKYSQMPEELIKVLQESNQVVPPELQRIADEVKSGARAVKYAKKW